MESSSRQDLQQDIRVLPSPVLEQQQEKEEEAQREEEEKQAATFFHHLDPG